MEVNGYPYARQQELKLLFPTAPGTYTIGPATLDYAVSYWDPAPKRLATEPITIEVDSPVRDHLI